MSFKDLVVIVTGAANGIGKDVSRAYAKQGAKVVLADVDETEGERHAEAIQRQGGEAIFVKTDVRKEDDILNLVEKTVSTYGTIHILINNAGVSRWKSPYELTIDEWDDIINTNLRSVFLCSREAAKVMRKTKAEAPL